jgi:integrase
LGTLFRWALDLDLITADPTSGTRLRAKPVPRDRVLSDREIVLFWQGCERLGWPFRDLFRLLLLTGQRRAEVAGVRWAEIDLEARTWTIPRERSKNDKSAFGALIRPGAGDHQRSASAGADGVLDHWCHRGERLSHAKVSLDKAIAEANGAPIADWVLHDL